MKKQIIGILFLLSFAAISQATPTGKGKADSLYQEAYNQLLSMLDGKTALRLCKAVYISENAYLGDSLIWESFSGEVENLAFWSEIVAKQAKLIYPYPDSNDIRRQYGIYTLFTESLALTAKDMDTLWTAPYSYDTLDFMGQQDWRQMFVSKLMVSGKGNCHSLPYLYKMVAEVLGIKAPLALAPNHIYLQMPTKNYHVHSYNIELTSKTNPIDGWIMASGYIRLEAIQKGLYMYPLTDKESIALVLVDLAQGWQRKYAKEDETFALQCVETALHYFPKCANALLLKAELLATKYRRKSDEHTLSELNSVCSTLYNLGYDQMPEQMYWDWLTGSDSKYSRSEYAPFAEQQKGVLTLSKGRYLESHKYEVIEQIGRILFNAEMQTVHGFQPLQKIGDMVVKVEISARFLSIDPMGAAFPELTPYQFASNSPLAMIDLDGLEGVIRTGAKEATVVLNVYYVGQGEGNVANYYKEIRASENTYIIGPWNNTKMGEDISVEVGNGESAVQLDFETTKIHFNRVYLNENGEPLTFEQAKTLAENSPITIIYQGIEKTIKDYRFGVVVTDGTTNNFVVEAMNTSLKEYMQANDDVFAYFTIGTEAEKKFNIIAINPNASPKEILGQGTYGGWRTYAHEFGHLFGDIPGHAHKGLTSYLNVSLIPEDVERTINRAANIRILSPFITNENRFFSLDLRRNEIPSGNEDKKD